MEKAGFDKDTCHNIKLCLKAEEIVNNISIKIDPEMELTLAGLERIRGRIFDEVYSVVGNLKLENRDWEHIDMHLNLLAVTTKVLTQKEFEMVFRNYPKVDFFSQDRIWKHNRNCLPLFINRYNRLLQNITHFLTRIENTPQNNHSTYLHVYTPPLFADKMVQEVISIQEILNFFPFCKECLQWAGAGKVCLLWELLQAKFELIMKGAADVGKTRNTISKTIAKLSEMCNCPASLKQLREI